MEKCFSIKSVKDILTLLKMVMRFRGKNEWINNDEWNIKCPPLEVLITVHHKKHCIAFYKISHLMESSLPLQLS